MRQLNRGWRYLAYVLALLSTFLVTTKWTSLAEAAALPEGPFGSSYPAAAATSIFEPLFWLVVAAIVLIESILIIAERQSYLHRSPEAGEFRANAGLELLWTAVPAVFIVALALFSMPNLRRPDGSITETVLVFLGLILLLVSTAVFIHKAFSTDHNTVESEQQSSDSLERAAPIGRQKPNLENRAYSSTTSPIVREPELSGGKR